MGPNLCSGAAEDFIRGRDAIYVLYPFVGLGLQSRNLGDVQMLQFLDLSDVRAP